MDKPFKSIDEQIAILEGRGLECDNNTRLVLEREGYYPVINGYKDLFLDQRGDSCHELFVKGTKFSDIYRLFEFDRTLRLLMFEYFNKAEAVLKTVCSYRFAMAHKDSPEAYLDRDSYRADAGYRKKIDTLIGDFEKVLCRSKKWNSDYKRDYIRHYENNHDNTPVWILMNYLRLEDMSSDYVFEDCQVEKIVRKAVKKFAAQFIGKKISIELNNLDTNVKTDEKWLGFIIEQLISNAVKYTRNGGKISIYMKETFNSADRILVIEDNGIGITKEDIPRIFERGYTGYNGRMSKKSSGIGLYLCRKAADKLGISIAIESKLDKGTKVLLDMTQKYISHE